MVHSIFILGATGRVGGALIRQVFEKRDTDSVIHSNPTRIVGVASKSAFAFSPSGLSKSECENFSKRSGKFHSYKNPDNLLAAADKVALHENDTLAFVDVTAEKDMYKFHSKIIEETDFGVVTANKNPVSLCTFRQFRELTENPARYGYSCSVMAGAQSIPFLQDLCDVNDRPQNISGCFSGTLGYICSGMQKGRAFSEVLADVHALGYTEPHPRDDLNGLDVARKILVLARTAGFDLSLEDVKVEPFIPAEYLEADDITQFMSSMKELDSNFRERLSDASNSKCALRYVAEFKNSGNKSEVSASLKEVPLSSPLGMLEGTANKITIISSAYPQNSPYIIESPGAGLEVTAQNIRRNLLHQLAGNRKVAER